MKMLIFFSLWFFVAFNIAVNGKLMPLNFNLDFSIDETKDKFRQMFPKSQDDPFLGIKSKTGFVKIGRKGGKMFYWIVPKDQTGSEPVDLSKPFVMWLNGGPGCSSELALFTENGPLTIQEDGSISRNPYSWHTAADMLFVDQPLGTGFSQAGDICNYATDESTIARDMKEFMEKFLYLYPEYKKRPFYITGESYAGHYIPSIAYELLRYPVVDLNFAGVAIGNGWVDPVIQYPAYATFAYEHHLIGKMGYEIAQKALKSCVEFIKKGLIFKAILQCNFVVNSILGKKNPYDIRLDCEVPPSCYNMTSLTTFLNRPDIQKRIGVKKPWIENDLQVYAFLLGDFDTETKTKVSALVEHGLKVLIYSGDQDFICNWRGGEAWVAQLDWRKSEEFSAQQYKPWKIGGKPAGEYRQIDNFAFLRVYDAGHMVPMDQPVVALEMFKEFLLQPQFKQKLLEKPERFIQPKAESIVVA